MGTEAGDLGIRVGGEVVPYPKPSSAAASAVARGNRKADTRPEIRLRAALHRRGLRFRKHLRIKSPAGVTAAPDVVFSRARVAVFVDGCFWHSCPLHGSTPRANEAYWKPKLEANVRRDRVVTESLAADGWQVIRVWEHEPVDQVADRVARAIRMPSAIGRLA